MKCFIEVYGCQMNVSDSELIAGILSGAGWGLAEDPGSADAVLIVTCAVREHAETRALGRAAQIAGLRRHGRRPVIAVCGCVAQEHGVELLRRHPGIDHVVGPDRYRELPGILAGPPGTSETGLGGEDYEGVEPVRRTFPSAFVSIMRGCDNFCSYCIVPLVRGRERSRRPGAVLADVAGLARSGYGEITLLGQNVNSYESDGWGFPRLLAEVAEAASPAWVRFVTSHPRDFTDELIEVVARHPNVCRQVHLPVQSGSSRVLGLMNRGYGREEYLNLVRRLRSTLPGVVLSTDIIAGFPGETEADFEDTASLLSEVRYDYAFLFRYSERAGTAAAALPDSVPEEIRLSRLGILQNLQAGITRERSSELAGRMIPVLVTGRGSRPGQSAGRTAGNRMVVFDGEDLEQGAFVRACVISGDGWTHFARSAGVIAGGSSRPPADERDCR